MTCMRYTLIIFFILTGISFGVQAQQDGANPRVRLETTLGDMVIELFETKAPQTVKNFLSYVDSGHYNGTIFHRVIKNFMIQGGGFTADMQQKPTNPPVQNEADNGLKNLTGTIAMARTPNPHSATAQFFINVKDNGFLDHKGKNMQGWGYCVFGRVIKGLEIVHQIEQVPTTRSGGHADVPITPVIIKSAARVAP